MHRSTFIITQKDPKVLYYIKKHLGFGVVRLDKANYYRYVVSDRQNISYLVNLISGRLILEKTKERYLK